jgi:hypothetical protein
MLADLHALTALNTDIGLCCGTLGYDLDARQVGIKLLVESIGASTNTLQASHTLRILFNSELLHIRGFSFSIFCIIIIQPFPRNGNKVNYIFYKNIF